MTISVFEIEWHKISVLIMFKSLLFYLIAVPKFNGSVEKGAPGHKTWKKRSVLILCASCRTYRHTFHKSWFGFYLSFPVSAGCLGTYSLGFRG